MKKFTAIIICLLMVFACTLSGCAGFNVNLVKYYNTVVATVGDTKITRHDVLSAYNSYGYYYYVSQQGMSEADAMNELVDTLINREMLYQYAVDAGEIYKPTAKQVNNIVIKIFDSLDSQMDSYYATARTYYRLDKIEDPTDGLSDSETAYLYADYNYANSRRATLEQKIVDGNVEYYIQYGEENVEYNAFALDENVLNDFTSNAIIDAIKSTYMAKLHDRLANKDTANAKILEERTLSLFTKDLINYEKYLLDENGKHYSKDTNGLIWRYFNRTFDEQIKSQYLTNLNEHYLKNEKLSTDKIVEKYKELVYADYGKYAGNISAYETNMKSIGTGADKVFYHPDTVAYDNTKFGYFIHTLVAFSEEQKSIVSGLNEMDDDYETDLALVVADTFGAARDDKGIAGEKNVPIADIIDEYNSIANIDENNYGDRLEEFIQFMFKYTEDATSTLVAGMPYVVGNNGYSTMVEEFTNMCLDLMYTDVNGKMFTADLGNTDSLCITSYGIHFIMYVGPVNDVLPFNLANKSNNEILSQLNTELNPLTHETVFDYLFDTVYPKSSSYNIYTSNTGYDDYEKGLIDECTKNYNPQKFIKKIKATKYSV